MIDVSNYLLIIKDGETINKFFPQRTKGLYRANYVPEGYSLVDQVGHKSIEQWNLPKEFWALRRKLE